MHRKISTHVDGGQAEGLACVDPGVRTAIDVSGNIIPFHAIWDSLDYYFWVDKLIILDYLPK